MNVYPPGRGPAQMPHWTGPGAVPQFPRIDMFESESGYHILVEVPGIDHSGLDVYCEPGALTIAGSHVEETALGRPISIERPLGDFQRRIPIPDDIDVDSITAKYDRGLLHVELKRPDGRASSRRIKVTASRRKAASSD